MTQEELFSAEAIDKFLLLSEIDKVEYLKLQNNLIKYLQQENFDLKAKNEETRQKKLLVEEQLITLKNKLYGKSSEKPASKEDRKNHGRSQNNKKKRVQLPSLRYPDLQLIEREVTLDTIPSCKCCGSEMSDSGMTENSEFLTSIPAQHIVVRQKRHKYRCGSCHGDIVTAPAPARIKLGSGYSDEMIINVAMSKYCDLIPMDRYSKIAAREGVKDLPANSLIESSHNLADFVGGAYKKLELEIKDSKVLHADETPHKMLEDNNNKLNWYLWGFSNQETSYFKVHDTRSGDVASSLLKDSKCEYLMSDVFSGYSKAIRETNIYREQNNLTTVQNVYCNAHARRKFKESELNYTNEAKFFIENYEKIYRLEKMRKKFPDKLLRLRTYMLPIYEAMKTEAMQLTGAYSSKSSIGKALNYFLKHYNEFKKFVTDPDLPIDNNSQERLLRNPVIGRKTWYGNHSQRGARTSAILFSLVESCKLNKINPREYFKNLVQDLHQNTPPYTPREFKYLKEI